MDGPCRYCRLTTGSLRIRPDTSSHATQRQSVSASRATVPAAVTLETMDDPRLVTLEAIRTPVWIFDLEDSRVLWANQSGLDHWAAESIEALGNRDMSSMSPSVRRRLSELRDRFALRGGHVSEHWAVYPRGVPSNGEAQLSGFAREGKPHALLVQMVYTVEGELSRSLHSAQAMLHTPVLVIQYDADWRAGFANPAAVRAMPERHGHLPTLLADARDLERLETALDARGEFSGEVRVREPEGAWLLVHATASTNAVSGAPARLVSATDVTARHEAEAEVRRIAFTDTLTELPNREALVRELEARCEQPECFALLILDLDRFASINDGLGYAVGDVVLQEIAERLSACSPDFAARLSGDEFAVIVTDEGATGFAQTLIDAVSEPVRALEQTVRTRASIGLCCYPQGASSAAQLLRHSDVALSQAKAQGGGIYLFDEVAGAEIAEQMQLEHDLAGALERGELHLHYQPRVDARTGEVQAFEALARWQHPELGPIGPDRFITIAEESGLIVELGAQVLSMAMTQQAAWAWAGYDVTVSINVSSGQMHGSDLYATIVETLAHTGARPERIELEVTESMLDGDIDAMAEVFERIAALGVAFSMDDFGTGYSNLGMLNRYPLKALKIDRCFVVDPSQAPLLEAIVVLGRALGLKLVAEGVETREQAEAIAARGIEQIQGFYFSRPLPAREASSYLADCVQARRAA